MSVQALHDARSRFIKAYLFTWGILAAAGAGYLVSLTWQSEVLGTVASRPQPPQPQVAEVDPGLRAANRALAELRNVRRDVDSVQKDVGFLKESVERQESEGKATQSRLTALEERVTTLSAQAAAPSPALTAKQKAAEKAAERAAAKAKTADARSPHVISVVPTPPSDTPPAPQKSAGRATPAPGGIETGSIPKPAVTFGETVVMPVQNIYAVQLAAAPSIESLRLTWSLLVERHGAELAALQPRVVAPRIQGGTYRLVAGPLTSAADADRICTELQARRSTCAATDFGGEPL